jgi:hypothetical protein
MIPMQLGLVTVNKKKPTFEYMKTDYILITNLMH